MNFVCNKCEHEWRGAMELPAPIGEVTAWMKAVKCPNCGAGISKLAILCRPIRSAKEREEAKKGIGYAKGC